MVGITHGVFFLRIGKDTLNSLLAHGVNVFRQLGFAQLFRQIYGLLPDVTIYHFPPIGIGPARFSARAVPANLRGAAVLPFSLFVGDGMPEDLPLWADQPVVFFVIGKNPKA